MPGKELFSKDAQNLQPRLTTSYPLDTLIQKLQNLEAQPHLTLSGSRNVTGISMDSRSVREGNLYVALPGAKTHEASFAAAAVAAGAAGILTDAQGQRIITETHLDLADTALIMPSPRVWCMHRCAFWAVSEGAPTMWMTGTFSAYDPAVALIANSSPTP